MTALRDAAQQALEAWDGGDTEWFKRAYTVMDALRAALAEHDKKIVWVEERKAHWAEQLQLARETQERERQQREEAALAEPVQEPVAWMHVPYPDNGLRPVVSLSERREPSLYGASVPLYLKEQL